MRQQFYDAAGNVYKTVDPANRETITTFDVHGRVDKVTAPGNRITSYGYDELGRTKTVTSPRGGIVTTTYTPAGRTKTVTNATGLVTTYTYDLAGRAKTVVAPGNLTTTYDYNTESELIKITSPAGRITNLGYDAASRVHSITDPAGVVTTRFWSTRGELLTEKIGAQGTAIWEYNGDRSLKWVIDPLGYKTTFGYDNRGNRTTRTNAAGGNETWKYNTANELTEYKDQLGRLTTSTYDPNGRPKTVTDPAGRVTTTAYNPDGTPQTTSYLNGGTVSYAYNPDGTLSTVTDPSGAYSFTYDPAGALASETAPGGRTTRWAYDNAGRRTSLTYPDGTSYNYAYDPAGRLATITPAEITADTFTQTATAPDPNGWTATISAGATRTVAQNTLALTWANTAGSTVTAASKAAAATNHDIVATYRFTVTGATNTGKLALRARSTATSNIRVEIPSGSTTATIIHQTAAATSATLGTFIVPADTAAHKVRLRVNNLDIKVKVWDPAVTEPAAWTKSVVMTGAVTAGIADIAVTRTAGTGSVIIDDWRQMWPSTPQSTEASYAYNTDSQLTVETLRGGTRTWSYNSTNGQLTGFAETLPGLSRTTAFAYDTTARIKTEVTGGVTTTYGYDLASQLLSATPSTGTANSWTYDQLGRRSTDSVGAVTTKYQYNATSQLCWTTTGTMPATPTCVAPPTGATTYTYDASGRRLTETVTATKKATYTYDPAGRLTKIDRVSTTSTTQTRSYTPDGRLAGIANTTGGVTTPWTFDWDLTGGNAAQLLAISSTSGTRDLIAGNGISASTRTGAATNAVGVDPYGSVLSTTSVTNLSRTNTYSAYGTPNGGANTFDPRLGYRGELVLDNLIHLRARNYQPGIGQFTSRDPLDGVTGTTTITNPYHYADNAPIAKADPTGMSPTRPAILDAMFSSEFDWYPEHFAPCDETHERMLSPFCGGQGFNQASPGISAAAAAIFTEGRSGTSLGSTIGDGVVMPTIDGMVVIGGTPPGQSQFNPGGSGYPVPPVSKPSPGTSGSGLLAALLAALSALSGGPSSPNGPSSPDNNDEHDSDATPQPSTSGSGARSGNGNCATNNGQFWPDRPQELDAMLGIAGRRVPDGSTTPGRGKVIWDLPNGKRITYEAHPYHTDAPAFHREPHYHVDQAGARNHSPSGRRLPGDPFEC